MSEPAANSGGVAPPAPTYGRAATRGMLWMWLATIIARVAALGAQWVLGLVLAVNDFKLYGIAIGLQTMTRVMTDGGTAVILVQRGKEYDRLARPVLTVAAMFNLIAAGAMLAVAQPAAIFYDAPGLPPLLWVIAVSIILRTPVTNLYARLSILVKFRSIARIRTTSALIRNASMIIFALLGCGPLSFVLPLILMAIYEATAAWLVLREFPTDSRLTWPLFKSIFRDARWVMLGALGISFIVQGDKLILGKLTATGLFAAYFFGTQLTTGVTTPIYGAISSVFMPTLSKLSGEPRRQAAAYLKGLRLLTLIGAPVCVGVAVVAAPAITFLWHGKWDNAVPAVQVFCLGLTVTLCSPIALSVIEARGRWRLRAMMLCADSVGVVAAAGIGAFFARRAAMPAAGVFTMAAWMTAYRMASALAQCIFAGRTISVSALDIVRHMFRTSVVFVAIGVGVHLAMTAVLPARFGSLSIVWDALLRAIIIGSLYGALAATVLLGPMRSSVAELLAMIGTRKRPANDGP